MTFPVIYSREFNLTYAFTCCEQRTSASNQTVAIYHVGAVWQINIQSTVHRLLAVYRLCHVNLPGHSDSLMRDLQWPLENQHTVNSSLPSGSLPFVLCQLTLPLKLFNASALVAVCKSTYSQQFTAFWQFTDCVMSIYPAIQTP